LLLLLPPARREEACSRRERGGGEAAATHERAASHASAEVCASLWRRWFVVRKSGTYLLTSSTLSPG
jgi:hypothetical protein